MSSSTKVKDGISKANDNAKQSEEKLKLRVEEMLSYTDIYRREVCYHVLWCGWCARATSLNTAVPFIFVSMVLVLVPVLLLLVSPSVCVCMSVCVCLTPSLTPSLNSSLNSSLPPSLPHSRACACVCDR